MAWTLHEGSCLDVLPTLEAGSVSHVVTDPPYAQTNEKYDNDIACRPDVWRECYRVCGENAALLAFAGSPTYHRIASAIEAGGWRVRQMWAWVYRDGMITSAWPREGFDRLAPAMSPIVFATKGKCLLTLEREGAAWESWHPRRSGGTLSSRAGSGARRSAPGHWPKSLVATDGIDGLQYFALSNNAVGQPGEKAGHPNQKPLALMEWLCGKLPRGVALDPFAGSGSTLAAALNVGHKHAVGVEQNPAYCDIIRRRMVEHEAKTPLFADASQQVAIGS